MGLRGADGVLEDHLGRPRRSSLLPVELRSVRCRFGSFALTRWISPAVAAVRELWRRLFGLVRVAPMHNKCGGPKLKEVGIVESSDKNVAQATARRSESSRGAERDDLGAARGQRSVFEACRRGAAGAENES